MLADGDAALDAEVLNCVEVAAAPVPDGPEDIVVVPLLNVASPAPSCWNINDVPFKATFCV